METVKTVLQPKLYKKAEIDDPDVRLTKEQSTANSSTSTHHFLLLFLILIMMALTCGFILLCTKVNQLKSDLSKLNSSSQGNLNSLVEGKIIYEPIEQTIQQSSGQHSKPYNQLFKNEFMMTGIRSYETYYMPVNESKVVMRKWKIRDGYEVESTTFELIDQSTIKIKKSGLYNLYAQLAWRKRNGAATFQVQSKTDILFQCGSFFPPGYAVPQTCYSSITQYIKEGEEIFVSITTDNGITVEFKDWKSYFGMTLLSEDGDSP